MAELPHNWRQTMGAEHDESLSRMVGELEAMKSDPNAKASDIKKMEASLSRLITKRSA